MGVVETNKFQNVEGDAFWQVRLSEIMLRKNKPSCFYYYGYPKRATFLNTVPLEDSTDLLEEAIKDIEE